MKGVRVSYQSTTLQRPHLAPSSCSLFTHYAGHSHAFFFLITCQRTVSLAHASSSEPSPLHQTRVWNRHHLRLHLYSRTLSAVLATPLFHNYPPPSALSIQPSPQRRPPQLQAPDTKIRALVLLFSRCLSVLVSCLIHPARNTHQQHPSTKGPSCLLAFFH